MKNPDNIVELDKILAALRKQKKGKPAKRKQADVLIELAQKANLFHAPDGTSYADIEIAGHRETWPIRRKGFRKWLARQFFDTEGGAPGSEALQASLNVIEAQAQFDGVEQDVYVRIGEHGGRIYIDLGDSAWRAIEVDADGWRVIDAGIPVRFRRSPGMKPLPDPVPGGNIEALTPYVNVKTKNHFVLIVAWALAALRARGPYPVLVLAGEQGSAKSTLSKLLRSLIDPNSASLRALPREDRDLFIAASNAHCLVFDNVSGLPFWISDTVCRLATGGGFAVRALYTDQDEILFEAQRPLILNGIEDVVERPDLADRSIFLTLDPIPKAKRRAEKELLAAFDKDRPQILGALLDAMVIGLHGLPDLVLDELPRMADFAMWGSACEAALWTKGTFLTAYTSNINEATYAVIEIDIVGPEITEFMTGKTEWVGAAKDLLACLDTQVGETAAKRKEWPKTPAALAGKLRRLAASLRRAGLEMTRLPREMHARPIKLEWVGEKPSSPSSPSSGPDSRHFRHDGSHDDDGRDDGWGSEPSCDNPPENNENDSHDGHDGYSHPYSGDSDSEDEIGDIPDFLRRAK